jgi:hypothetical protein
VIKKAAQAVIKNPVPQKISTILEFFNGRLTSQSRVIKARIKRPRIR